MGGKIPDKSMVDTSRRSLVVRDRDSIMESGLRVCHPEVGSENLLADGPVFVGVDFVAILVFPPDEEAGKRCGSAFVDHGLNLPDHAAFANASVRERRTAVACVVEKIVSPVAGLRIGGSLERSFVIQLEQTAAVFHRQWRRAFLAEIDAYPATVSGGNQEALGRPAMENKIEGGRAEHGSGDEDGKAEDNGDDERGSAHAELLRSDPL